MLLALLLSSYACAAWGSPFPSGMDGTGLRVISFGTPGDSAANCWVRVKDKLIFFCTSSALKARNSASAWLRSCKQGNLEDLKRGATHVDLLLNNLCPYCPQFWLRLGAQLQYEGMGERGRKGCWIFRRNRCRWQGTWWRKVKKATS